MYDWGNDKMRTIGVLTTCRADWGAAKAIIKAVMSSDETLAEVYGLQWLGQEPYMTDYENLLDTQGYWFQVPIQPPADTLSALPIAYAQVVDRVALWLNKGYSDCLVVVGDRWEAHAAATASYLLQIPIVHIHGGELTHGVIDDGFRHSITKLASLHFVSLPVYADRIKQMGEEPWRVFVSGAPSLDNLVDSPQLSDQEMAKQGIVVRKPFVLATLHAETLDSMPGDAGTLVTEMVTALKLHGQYVIITLPGMDIGGKVIAEVLEQYAKSNPDVVQIVRNITQDAYWTLCAQAECMVGNSSSGILEAASFRLPVVNVGTRQDGRFKPANVIDCEGTSKEILIAMRQATSAEFRKGIEGLSNPYHMNGEAGKMIAETLAQDWEKSRLLKKQWSKP